MIKNLPKTYNSLFLFQRMHCASRLLNVCLIHSLQPEQKLMRTDWQFAESKALIRFCINKKEILKFYRHRDYSNTWLEIQSKMRDFGYYYTVDSMKKRLSSMLKWSKRCQPKWPLKNYCDTYLSPEPKAASTSSAASSYAASTSSSNDRRKVHGIHVMDDCNPNGLYIPKESN